MIKNYLLGLKLNFIINSAPEQFTHWNEDEKVMNFYSYTDKPITIKKPLWLRCIELIIYKR